MGWVESGWVGSKNFRNSVGWVGLSLSDTQICVRNRRTAVTAPLIHSVE